ncbi:hypothetical protein PV08_08230 [Exophiala spinifera]|uniref:Uncharacterized protein n=1 Tax=Exophiala spinifera TaxID=91928 RepID=A0A0D2B2D6_9EURO|nr:uncharacterized protein PV08_08230 [Exophiala spinifera]KIW13043.1 hypothetical protein PV08_08230 [Exophiala spinifera]
MYRKVNTGEVSRGFSKRPGTPSEVEDSHRRMSGRLVDIWTAFAIVTIPMLAFSAVLLGLVYRYRVTHSTTGDSRLRSPGTTDEAGVYYVNLSATVLIFISSWSSSVGPLLLGFLMTLASYPLTRHYWQDIQEQKPTLPTPFQFALSLKFLGGGGWGALYSWMQYLIGWKHQRQLQSRLLTESAFATVIVTILGIVVFLADTWLHITTSTVSFVDTNPATGTTNYSLSLVPGCLTTNNSGISHAAQCNLIQASTGTFLFDPAKSLTVLNNVSDSIEVHNNGPDERYAYLGVPQSGPVGNLDYTATTFGMRTECRAASRACNLNAAFGASTPFKCTDAFAGDLQVDTWLESYFPDSAMASNITGYGVGNPFYYGVGAGFQTVTNSELENSDEIVTPVHGGMALLLSCSIWIFDVEYDSINGTVTRFVATPSNDSVANIWQLPNQAAGVTTSNLQTAMLIAVSTATSIQDLADQYAVAYSKVALGVGAQSVELSPAMAAQERSSFLVTRLPMAPLFCLIAANLAFVVLGITLTYMALSTSSGGEVRDVQARLSIVGLVADRFEPGRSAGPATGIEELFKEHSGQSDSVVVAMERTADGGFAYREWTKITDP